MNRLFSKFLVANTSLRFNLPLAERNRKYKVRDIRINAIKDDGSLINNGHQKLTVLLDQDRVVDNVVGGTLTGTIASMDLNQDVYATSDIEIILSDVDGVTVPADVIGFDISFIVADPETEKEIEERRKA